MADNELEKLHRLDLVEIIYELQKELEEQEKERKRLEQRLEEKELKIENAGSIARAAMDLSKVMEAAQEAADVYLVNVMGAVRKSELEAAQAVAEAAAEADEIREKAGRDACKLASIGRAEAEKVKNDARTEAGKIREEARAGAEKLRREAQEEADRILAEARTEADKILGKAHRQADQMAEEIKKAISNYIYSGINSRKYDEGDEGWESEERNAGKSSFHPEKQLSERETV